MGYQMSKGVRDHRLALAQHEKRSKTWQNFQRDVDRIVETHDRAGSDAHVVQSEIAGRYAKFRKSERALNLQYQRSGGRGNLSASSRHRHPTAARHQRGKNLRAVQTEYDPARQYAEQAFHRSASSRRSPTRSPASSVSPASGAAFGFGQRQGQGGHATLASHASLGPADMQHVHSFNEALDVGGGGGSGGGGGGGGDDVPPPPPDDEYAPPPPPPGDPTFAQQRVAVAHHHQQQQQQQHRHRHRRSRSHHSDSPSRHRLTAGNNGSRHKQQQQQQRRGRGRGRGRGAAATSSDSSDSDSSSSGDDDDDADDSSDNDNATAAGAARGNYHRGGGGGGGGGSSARGREAALLQQRVVPSGAQSDRLPPRLGRGSGSLSGTPTHAHPHGAHHGGSMSDRGGMGMGMGGNEDDYQRLIMPPLPPRQVSATGTSVTVKWVCTEPSARCFELQFRPRNRPEWRTISNNIADRTYVLRNLPPGRGFFLRVRCMSDRGWSSFSVTSRVIRPQRRAPMQPTAPIATEVATDTVEVTWAPPASAGGRITLFTLLMGTQVTDNSGAVLGEDITMVYSGPDNWYRARDLQPKTRYTFRVIASNNHGDSDVSPPLDITTKEPEAVAPLRTIGDWSEWWDHHEARSFFVNSVYVVGWVGGGGCLGGWWWWWVFGWFGVG